MKALGIEVSSLGVAELYKDFLDVMVIDNKDENLEESLGEIINKVIITNTIMVTVHLIPAIALIV